MNQDSVKEEQRKAEKLAGEVLSDAFFCMQYPCLPKNLCGGCKMKKEKITSALQFSAENAARAVLDAIENEATGDESQMSNEGHMLAAARTAAAPFLSKDSS